MSITMITPKSAAQKLHEKPAQAGIGLLLIALLLKTAVVVKIATYACLTLGLLFLWESFKQAQNVPTKD